MSIYELPHTEMYLSPLQLDIEVKKKKSNAAPVPVQHLPRKGDIVRNQFVSVFLKYEEYVQSIRSIYVSHLPQIASWNFTNKIGSGILCKF
jgi:hypothetical protein